MNNLLAKSSETICFGPLCSALKQNPSDANAMSLLGSTIGKFINLALIGGGIFMLIYLLWGALDWIVSEGDKEKVEKARNKIQNAVIGMLLVVISLTIFGVVSGDILGIVTKTDNGWIINLPSLNP
ncbi:MAG: hypothetical protein HYW86_01105 [Candidatus Roizmanbacteria bacterium]|nr:MAG: hypothetical protein HYW86_01105 [Candidatus Roizmanbacteria bacterium]